MTLRSTRSRKAVPSRNGRLVVAIDCRAAREQMSGVGRYVVNLVEGLSSSAQFDLVLLVPSNPHQRLLQISGVRFVEVGHDGNAVSYLDRLRWEQLRLAAFLQDCHADVFHATWNYGVPWNCPCATVITLHDLIPVYRTAQFGSHIKRAAFLASQYFALYRSTQILLNSEATRGEVGRYAPWALDKCELVRFGVDPIFRPPTIPTARKHVLYVGGYEARKNVDGLLRAYEIAVRDMNLDMPLLLPGAREQLGADARVVFDGLDSRVRQNVRFFGSVVDGDLRSLYHSAAVFVFPSRFEGFGYPPLEAMACGTPVVTTGCGGLPEATGDAAHVVDPDNPEEIAGAMVHVTSNAIYRQELITRGLAHAATMRWPTVVAATSEVYRKAAGTTAIDDRVSMMT